MAYADLGGLGLKQGAPVVCDWAASSVVPQVLPWLAILALLLLKPNRRASAWWIWVPLGCVGAVGCLPHSVLGAAPSVLFEMLADWIGALGFGLAAVWLLSSYLGWRHRMLAWLGILLVEAAFSFLTYVVKQGSESLGTDTLALGIYLALSALAISVALSLAGLVCRGRYGWLRLSLWLVVTLVAGWLLVIVPLAVIMMITSGGRVPVAQLLVVVPGAAAITFGVMLPFLVLSFVNGFYGERLKGLLHLGGTEAPPMIAPPMSAVTEAVGG